MLWFGIEILYKMVHTGDLSFKLYSVILMQIRKGLQHLNSKYCLK